MAKGWQGNYALLFVWRRVPAIVEAACEVIRLAARGKSTGTGGYQKMEEKRVGENCIQNTITTAIAQHVS